MTSVNKNAALLRLVVVVLLFPFVAGVGGFSLVSAALDQLVVLNARRPRGSVSTNSGIGMNIDASIHPGATPRSIIHN